MANQSAKRIAQANASRLAVLNKVFLGVNGFYLVIRFVLQYGSLGWKEALMYLATVGLECMLYLNLYKMSQPRYDPGGVLVDAGTDLNQPGLVSYMFDYIYISWFVHSLSLVTRWAWMLYLAIPVYLLVNFWPYARQFLMPGGNEEPTKNPEELAREKKRQEKKERKQKRTKYVRM
ncbi:hypothetical protein GGF46_003973 [Coemansia sp. RSA 552]|nr:hypothetical protein GGF46_003973 [Coemansia sp. RSA 552]